MKLATDVVLRDFLRDISSNEAIPLTDLRQGNFLSTKKLHRVTTEPHIRSLELHDVNAASNVSGR